MTLEARWHATWADLGLPSPGSGALEALLARYREPARAYHTTRHLEECFAQFDLARGLAAEPGEVQLALWFHDAVYDTRSAENEERSAAWADRVLAGVGAPDQVRRRVRGLILATRHAAEPETDDARLVVDIDLSILGAPPPRFGEYEAQVRREYGWVPEPVFRQARAKILRAFLARPFVYATGFFRNRLEASARANLEASLARLGA